MPCIMHVFPVRQAYHYAVFANDYRTIPHSLSVTSPHSTQSSRIPLTSMFFLIAHILATLSFFIPNSQDSLYMYMHPGLKQKVVDENKPCPKRASWRSLQQHIIQIILFGCIVTIHHYTWLVHQCMHECIHSYNII